jgi:murein DD-endopeptidase MepM/ murein hydrolase activator NlpD
MKRWRLLWFDFVAFLTCLRSYFGKRARLLFSRFEITKSAFAQKLYQGRGRLSRPFSHFGFATLVALGIVLAPVLAQNFPGIGADLFGGENFVVVLSATDGLAELTTNISEKPRAEIMEYSVQSGDTISGIAQKFGVSLDTIRWANNLASIQSIKPGQILKILPVSGIAHQVKRGDTVYSLAKHYSTEAQGIADFPFNSFANDETFELAVGQILIIPDGVMPKVAPWAPGAYIAQKTPDAGTVTATGQFVWPASGALAQLYRWYHKGIDIANKLAPETLAADAGRVVMAGWPDNVGYGNRVLIDHGNGLQTLYGHLAKIFVSAGQTVNRGDKIGQMGTTGRSTGIHLHFEIRKNGAALDPLSFLK